MSEQQLYWVYSKSLITGNIAHGNGQYPKDEAQKYANEMNNNPDYADMLIFYIGPVVEE